MDCSAFRSGLFGSLANAGFALFQFLSTLSREELCRRRVEKSILLRETLLQERAEDQAREDAVLKDSLKELAWVPSFMQGRRVHRLTVEFRRRKFEYMGIKSLQYELNRRVKERQQDEERLRADRARFLGDAVVVMEVQAVEVQAVEVQADEILVQAMEVKAEEILGA